MIPFLASAEAHNELIDAQPAQGALSTDRTIDETDGTLIVMISSAPTTFDYAIHSDFLIHWTGKDINEASMHAGTKIHTPKCRTVWQTYM